MLLNIPIKIISQSVRLFFSSKNISCRTGKLQSVCSCNLTVHRSWQDGPLTWRAVFYVLQSVAWLGSCTFQSYIQSHPWKHFNPTFSPSILSYIPCVKYKQHGWTECKDRNVGLQGKLLTAGMDNGQVPIFWNILILIPCVVHPKKHHHQGPAQCPPLGVKK